MKINVTITDSRTDYSSDSDYETAIELVTYHCSEEVVTGFIDGVVPFTLTRTTTSSSSSFYEENEVTGGYGPGLIRDPFYDKCSESIVFAIGDEHVRLRNLCQLILASEIDTFEVEVGTKELSIIFDAKIELLIAKQTVNARRALRKSTKKSLKSISTKAKLAILEIQAAA